MREKKRISVKTANGIRAAREAGMTYRDIMMKFNVSQSTIYRYASDSNAEKLNAYESARYKRLRNDPEKYPIYRAKKREFQARYAKQVAAETKALRDEIKKLRGDV